MATLQLAFSDLYGKVSEFLGTGSSPTGAELTTAKDLVYRGYRRFLFPVILETNKIYVWSFLRKTGTLNTAIGTASYSLPTDLIGLISGFKFDNGENKDNPVKINMSQLRALRSKSVANDVPEYYAINMGDYDVTVIAPYYAWFHSPPDAVYTYKYDYIFEPAKPTADAELFVGGALASEVILECALAEAELQMDDALEIHATKAKEMISSFIDYDSSYFPNSNESDSDNKLFVPSFRMDK